MRSFRKILGAVLVGVSAGLLIFAGFVYLVDNDRLLRLLPGEAGIRNDLFTVRAYAVLSGSMEPAIKTGSLIISSSASEYSRGDIITFAPNGRGNTLVTHRIVGVSPAESERGEGYFTKGDANEEPDPWVVKEEQILGAATHSIPYVGNLTNFVKTPQGFVAFIIIPSTVIVWEEIKNLFSEIKQRLTRSSWAKASNGGRGALKAMVFVPLSGFLGLMVLVSGAWFFDYETVVNNVLGVHSNEVGVVYINEFMPNADTEWVEFYNASDSAEYLKSYYFDDEGSHKKTLLEYALNTDNVKFPYIELNKILNNNGDRLYLYDEHDNLVDEVEYEGSTKDASIGRDVDGTGVFKNCTTPTRGASNNGAC